MRALTMSRRGFTLIEIIAVLAIMALVAALISATLIRQQRLYRAASETFDVRRGVRDGISVLEEEIRGASAADTIRLASDSALELFTNLGASIACGSLSATDVGLAPPNANGIGLTSWLAVPDTGDLALVYRSASSTSGSWERYRISAVASRQTSSACPSGTGLGTEEGDAASSYVLTLPTLAGAVEPGTPIRFIRRGRYSLYKSSDARWYLGYRRCNALGTSVCGAIQPLAGALQPYTHDSTRTGLLFRYFDAGGAPIGGGGATTGVARIDVIARAVSPVTIEGAALSSRDSLTASVALRNRP